MGGPLSLSHTHMMNWLSTVVQFLQAPSPLYSFQAVQPWKSDSTDVPSAVPSPSIHFGFGLSCIGSNSMLLPSFLFLSSLGVFLPSQPVYILQETFLSEYSVRQCVQNFSRQNKVSWIITSQDCTQPEATCIQSGPTDVASGKRAGHASCSPSARPFAPPVNHGLASCASLVEDQRTAVRHGKPAQDSPQSHDQNNKHARHVYIEGCFLMLGLRDSQNEHLFTSICKI